MRLRLAEAEAFPDARAAVEGLRARYQVALLSNADDDFLLPCLERNGIAFETVVSSESARVYKPHEAIFHGLAAELGLKTVDIMYVGDSHFADVLGAKHAGLRVAWLNREGRAAARGRPPARPGGALPGGVGEDSGRGVRGGWKRCQNGRILSSLSCLWFMSDEDVARYSDLSHAIEIVKKGQLCWQAAGFHRCARACAWDPGRD